MSITNSSNLPRVQVGPCQARAGPGSGQLLSCPALGLARVEPISEHDKIANETSTNKQL